MRRLGTILALALLVMAAQATAKHGSNARDAEDEDGADGTQGHDQHRSPDRRLEQRLPGAGHHTPVAGHHGDTAVHAFASSWPGRLQFSFVVAALGGPVASGAHLQAKLPDLGSAWALDGPGASSCTLRGLAVDCALSGLAAGDAVLVQASAAVRVAPQWEPAATAALSGIADASAADDSATAGVGILLG